MSVTVYFRISEIKDNDFGGTIQVREIQFADTAHTVWPITAASAVGGTLDSGTLANTWDGVQTTFARWYTGNYPTSVTYSVTAPDGTALADAQAANIHQKDTGYMNCKVEFSTDNATWTSVFLGNLAGGTSTAYGSWTTMTATPDVDLWVRFGGLAPIAGTTIELTELAPYTGSGELQHASIYNAVVDVDPSPYSTYYLDDLSATSYSVTWSSSFPTYITQRYRMPFGTLLADLVSFVQASGSDVSSQLGACTVEASLDNASWTMGFTGAPNFAALPNTYASVTSLDFASGPTTLAGDAIAQATATAALAPGDQHLAGAATDQATAQGGIGKTDTLVGDAGASGLAWAELDKTTTLGGSASDEASAQATFPSAEALAGSATVEAEASGSLGTAAMWTARCIIAGVDVSAQLTGIASVDAEEGAARVATVVLQPHSGTVAPLDYVGKEISLDYVPANGSGIPQRLFTGKIDTPSYDPQTTLLTLASVDDLQNRVAAMELQDIDALVGGKYSAAVFSNNNTLVTGEMVTAPLGVTTLLAYDPDLTTPVTVEDPNGTLVYTAGTDYVMQPHGIRIPGGSTIPAPVDSAPNIKVSYGKAIALDHWEYAKDRLSTVLASLDGNAQGVLRITNWQGLSLYATYTDADLLYDHSRVTFPQASTLVNRVNISYTYRYPRLRQRVGSLSWSGQQNDMKLNGYVYPTQEELISAAKGTGWQITFQVFSNAPAEIPHPTGGRVHPREGAIDLAIFKLEQRHSQSVDEAYTITVLAPESIALHGEIAQAMSGALESRFDATVWENNLSLLPDLSSLGEEDWAPDAPRTTSDYAIQTLLDMAKAKIIGSHRSGRIGNAVLLNPLLDLDTRIAINTSEMQADGKVARVIHTMDFDTGSAITEFDLAIVSAGGAGIITPTVLDPPARIPPAVGVQAWQSELPPLTTATFDHTPYQDSLMGLLLNPLKSYTVHDVPQTVPPFGLEDISYENPYYVAGSYPVTGFRIQMPGVDGIDRNPITLAKAASYDVAIVPDTLTFTVP